MTVAEVMKQITIVDGKVKSGSTGNLYNIKDFIDNVSDKCRFTKSQKSELYSLLTNSIKPQSDASLHIEQIIEKYSFQFSDGVYIVKEKVISLDDIYRLLWNEEKLLPTETDYIIENIEKISTPVELQKDIFKSIVAKSKSGTSKYLASLDMIYPEIKWRNILYNVIVPKTKPLFHLFYDDGVGGTGKSTLLEVVTKMIGENFTSNVLLDQFGNRFIFANMLGKYVNIGDDNGKNDELQNVGTLKSIITGNRVTIDRKNISPIEVRIFAKQLYATNLFPYIDFTDGGIMRRLNVVSMNKIIPFDLPLCILDENEIGKIIYEVLRAKDLTENDNELAIKLNPLYRFYTTEQDKTYNSYTCFCEKYGFRKMNIINFETKSKFITAYTDGKKPKKVVLQQIEDKDMPW